MLIYANDRLFRHTQPTTNNLSREFRADSLSDKALIGHHHTDAEYTQMTVY